MSSSRRLDVIEGVLGIDPLMAESCKGSPFECGSRCEDDSCPLTHNTLHYARQELGDLIQEQLEIRCWAQELEEAGYVPLGTWDRAQVRARLVRLKERHRSLQEAARKGEHMSLQVVGKVQQSIETLQAEITSLHQKLGETKSC